MKKGIFSFDIFLVFTNLASRQTSETSKIWTVKGNGFGYYLV